MGDAANNKMSYMILMRHAERMDDPGREGNAQPIEISFDTQITDKGEDQSAMTGAFLRKLLGEETLKDAEIYVASSPFLRCVQTVSGVLDGAKVPESTAINIHDELSELLM